MNIRFPVGAFRLLVLGGAKLRTNDDTGGDNIEHDEVRYL